MLGIIVLSLPFLAEGFQFYNFTILQNDEDIIICFWLLNGQTPNEKIKMLTKGTDELRGKTHWTFKKSSVEMLNLIRK